MLLDKKRKASELEVFPFLSSNILVFAGLFARYSKSIAAMHPLRAYLQRFVPLLTNADWQPLAEALRPRHLARGEHFVQAGDYFPVIALVLSGALRLYYPRPDGEDRTTYFFFENHLLADYPGCLTGQPSQISIQALVDTELVLFDYAVLRQLYEERSVYERFGRLLAEYHLLGTDARLVEQLLLSPEERYRALLASGKTKILERIPQHLVANYLGITPVSLSRIRGRVARGVATRGEQPAGPKLIS